MLRKLQLLGARLLSVLNIFLLLSSAISLTLLSCEESSHEFYGHQLEVGGDILKIRYNGEGDVVQFKMFEGLDLILKQNKKGIFEGQLSIPDINNAIFSYDLLVHKKEASGKMIKVPYGPVDPDQQRFYWIGKNRNIDYNKSASLEGKVVQDSVESIYLWESRDISIYYPPTISDDTPIIYFTDGSVVADYAPYVDELIKQKKIAPVILIGVHSSTENRYQEYVNHGVDNELFLKHESFFYEEVLPKYEKEAWKSKRYLYGFSNGGAFSMYNGINHPEKFEKIIAYSTADYISEMISPIEFKFDKYPEFIMGAGRYEESIFNDNTDFVEKMKANNIDVEFKELISGHDSFVWKMEFLKFLEEELAVL
jgi:enterochelin esterase-like enzyme